jgi:hypothetical protein
MVFGRTYSKTIIAQGDPTSSPANGGGPGAVCIVTPVAAKVPRPGTVITRIGDPTSAPAVNAATPAPLVVQPPRQPPVRGQAILGAASADVYFSGPLINVPPAQRPPKPTSVILTPLDLSTQGTGTPVIVAQRPGTPRPPFIVNARQAQDGAAPDLSGPVPTQLVITRPPAPAPLTKAFSLIGAPAQAPSTATPPPVITRPRGLRRLARVIVRVSRVFLPPSTDPPVYDTPTQLTLDPHGTNLSLDPHGTANSLAAHASGVTLEAHTSGITLEAHQSGITLDP